MNILNTRKSVGLLHSGFQVAGHNSLTISTVPMVPRLEAGSAFFPVVVKPTSGGGYTASSLADYPSSCPPTLVDPYVDQRLATRGPASRNPPGIARCRRLSLSCVPATYINQEDVGRLTGEKIGV